MKRRAQTACLSKKRSNNRFRTAATCGPGGMMNANATGEESSIANAPNQGGLLLATTTRSGRVGNGTYNPQKLNKMTLNNQSEVAFVQGTQLPENPNKQRDL